MSKIGIIGAMDLEVETLKSHMQNVKITKKANMEFLDGSLNGTPAVIVKCGIGKVNAGMCVQILADAFDITTVINTGVAGSLNNNANIGDIIISSESQEHDMDVTALGYEPGIIPQMMLIISFRLMERLLLISNLIYMLSLQIVWLMD